MFDHSGLNEGGLSSGQWGNPQLPEQEQDHWHQAIFSFIITITFTIPIIITSIFRPLPELPLSQRKPDTRIFNLENRELTII